MEVEWLDLSLLDLQSHFTLSFEQLVLDVTILRASMTVTSMSLDTEPPGIHRKVTFHSDREFEVYLKFQLGRQLQKAKEEQG